MAIKRKYFVHFIITFMAIYAVWFPLSALSSKQQAFIKQYNLPAGPIRKKAEEIFSKPELVNLFAKSQSKASRPILEQTLKRAGFSLFKTWGNIVIEHPDLPGWIIKGGSRFSDNTNNIRRISQAEAICSYVQKYELNDIVVPQKYLFHLPGRDADLINNNYLIFCEKLDLSKKSLGHLTRDQIKQVCKIIGKIGMCDGQAENIRLLKNGKVAFIDTEPFLNLNTWWWQALETLIISKVKADVGQYIFRKTVKKEQQKLQKYAPAKNQKTKSPLLSLPMN